jgi:predicted secreted protein
MGWTTGIAVYIVIWWVVIFMVLPWGVRTVDDSDVVKGHASSAPKRPRMLAKVIATSLLAGVVWAIFYAIIESGVISFRS